jgi:hypothetical protein
MDRELAGTRRTFVKGAALLAGLTALFGITGPGLAKPPQPVKKPEPSGQGYRMTEHIKKYYETARR